MTISPFRLAVALMLLTPCLGSASSSQSQGDSTARGSVKDRVEATERWTDHLKLTTYPDDPTAAPGDRVALVVDIVPGARMHVYAPGADGYRLITLTVADHEFVRHEPIAYPPSEIYVFEPLNETIPVYQKPFTLMQNIVLAKGPEAEAAFRARPELTLTGTLDYQACDDRVCFNPVSVPVSWVIALRPAGESSPPAPR